MLLSCGPPFPFVALDGEDDLEEHGERRRRVAGKLELLHLPLEPLVGVVRLLAEVPHHVAPRVVLPQELGDGVDGAVGGPARRALAGEPCLLYTSPSPRD